MPRYVWDIDLSLMTLISRRDSLSLYLTRPEGGIFKYYPFGGQSPIRLTADQANLVNNAFGGNLIP